MNINLRKKIITAAVALTTVAMIAPGMASAALTSSQIQAIVGLLQSFGADATTIANVQATLSGSSVPPTSTPPSSSGVPAACVGMMLDRNLTVGASGADVKCLQAAMNALGYTIASSGPGSWGNETMYFGPLTLVAVQKYQDAMIGYHANQVGPSTRASLNAWISGGSPTTGGGPTGPTQGTGSVMVALSSDNPPSGSIVAGQATADLLHFTFTGSGMVNSLKLKRSGVSDQNTLTNVYLYNGNMRLTDGYSFNSVGEITVNNLNLMVSGAMTISVKADVSSSANTAGQNIAVALTMYNSNNVNVMGNTMFLASGSVLASVSFNAANTAVGGPAGTANVNAGTIQYSFWTQAAVVGVHAVQLKAANFKIVGSAPTDAVQNVKLYVDGVDSGKMAMLTSAMGSNYLFFDFSMAPLNLSTGSHTLEVRGDIMKGAARTVQFQLQQAADLMVFDQQVGVNVAVAGSSGVPSNGGTVSILQGSPTINNEPVFNAMTNVTGGSSNTVVGRYIVRAYGEDLKVTSLTVAPVLTSASDGGSNSTDASGVCTGTCGLKNVTLYFNGVQVGTQSDIAGTTAFDGSTTTKNFTLGSQMILPAGVDSTLEVRADLMNTSSSNWTSGTIGFNVIKVTSGATGQNSQNLIDFPTANHTGKTLSIQTGTLAISKDGGLPSQTLAPNASGVKVGSFVIQNQSTSESVRVTNLAVKLTYGASAGSTNFSALRTDETSGAGSNPIQPSTAAAGGNATDNFSVNFTLAPGASKTLGVYMNSGNIAGSNVTIQPQMNVSFTGVSSNVSSTTGLSASPITMTFNTGTVANPPTLVVSTSTPAQYVAAGTMGSTNAAKATFNIVSTGGASTITELKFTVSGSTGNTVTNVCVASMCASPVSEVAYLTGLNLNVPNGGSGLTQDVWFSYAPVGSSGLQPSSTSIVSLSYIEYTSGGTTSTLCQSGGGCTATLSGSGLLGVVPSNQLTLVGSKPTLTVGSGGSTGMVLNASTKVGQVTLTADAKGDVRLRQFNFALGYSGFTTAPTSIASAFLALGGQSTAIAGTSCTAVSTTNVVCGAHSGNGVAYAYAGDLNVPAGTSQQFDLYVTTAGATNTGTNKAQIATTLVNGTSTSATAGTTSAFLWSDTSNNGGAGSTDLTGTLIYNFPTNAYSVSQ
jgi:hypothetical protein